MKSIITVLLICYSALHLTSAVAAQWTLHRAPSDTGGDHVLAVQVNDSGSEIKVFRNGRAEVFLEFKKSPGFSGLSRSSCPTFQIDRRIPMHYFNVDQSCHIDADRVVYDLGQIRDNALTSLVVHRLMNGGKVAFRYLTQDGTYHESRFELSRSKEILTSALGVDTLVTPY